MSGNLCLTLSLRLDVCNAVIDARVNVFSVNDRISGAGDRVLHKVKVHGQGNYVSRTYRVYPELVITREECPAAIVYMKNANRKVSFRSVDKDNIYNSIQIGPTPLFV